MSDTDEQIILVDQNDQIQGYKLRTEQLPSDRYRITAVWVENSAGDVLLAQRSYSKDYNPGLWGPTSSGTVVKGEDYEQNALKELAEEVGITGYPLTLIEKVAWDGGPSDIRVCSFYKVVCDWPAEKFILQESEVEAVRWISKHDLLKELSEQPQIHLPNTRKWMDRLNLVD